MPKIDLTSIPGLESAQALFGTIMPKTFGMDEIVEIMVFLYETAPPPPPPPGLF